jgi:dolichyl-phosphate-mannose-protein mannosyltransferase
MGTSLLPILLDGSTTLPSVSPLLASSESTLTNSSHYFPALYFAIIAVCQIYDFLFNRFVSLGLPQRPVIGGTVAVVYLALSVAAFTLYSPLAYGNMWTQAECKRVKLFDTWDWDCNNFLTSVSNSCVCNP